MLKRLFLSVLLVLGTALAAQADPPANPALQREFNGNGGPIIAIGFNPKLPTQLAIGTTRGALRVKDLTPAEQDVSLMDTAGWLAYSPIVVAANPNGAPTGGPSLCTLSPHGRFTIWYPDTFQRQSYQDDSGTMGTLSADGRIMACTFGKIDIYIWPLHHWDPSWHSIGMARPGIDGVVTALGLNHNGSVLVSGYLLTNGQGSFIVWDRLTGKILNVHPLDQAPGTVVFSPRGTHLAVTGRTKDGKGLIELYQPRGDAKTAVLGPPTSPVLSAIFSPDEKLLACGRWDGTIDLWDVKAQKVIYSLPAHKGPVRALDFTPNGKTLASGGEDGYVRLWDVSKLK